MSPWSKGEPASQPTQATILFIVLFHQFRLFPLAERETRTQFLISEGEQGHRMRSHFTDYVSPSGTELFAAIKKPIKIYVQFESQIVRQCVMGTYRGWPFSSHRTH